jgi:hypothetical protein
MANPDHIAQLKKGVRAWNAWRDEDRLIIPDLIIPDLSRGDLRRANLSGANLARSTLFSANLSGADLSDAPRASPRRLGRRWRIGWASLR